jgi:NodT family efflux transporter outer membrane factor (OMF) lipoprotein
VCLLLAGCTVGPNFAAPTPWWSAAAWGPAPKPEIREKVSRPVAEPVDPQWWKLLDDPLLTSLETRLVTTNLDLRVATTRLAESRAQLGVAQAALLPQLGGTALYSSNTQSKTGDLVLAGGNHTGLTEPHDNFQVGFDASWELDFWGHVARNVESAEAGLEATGEGIHDVQVTASAELARDYVQLRGTQRKLGITRENLATAQESLRLTQERASGGVTTDLDVANAAAQVESTAAQIPSLEAQQAQLMNAVAFLLGDAPRALEVELAAPRAVPPVPPRVPVGLPSELARRRPDVRRAEAQLHGATADVGVAVADLYPRFTLGGNAELQGLDLRKLGDWASRAYTFGPTVTLPIFNAGRLARTMEFREAVQKEAALTYQRTVLGALHDVDNALTAYDTEQRRRDRLAAAVEQNRRALSLARMRYDQGVADFLQVLVAQTNLLAADQALADSTTTVSTNLVQLYKALGGGWDTAGG